MSTHTDTQTEFGVVFEDADITDGMNESDLVRHASDSMARATSAAIDAKARGVRSAIALREPGQEWVTMYGRQRPSEWVAGIRRSA